MENNEEYLKAEAEVRKMIEEGSIPIVDLSIFDILDNLNPSDSIKGKIEYTLEEYETLLKMIKKLPALLQTKYLLTSKNADVIDNQVLEQEDSFLISLQHEIDSVSALDMTIDHYGREFDRDTFIKIHDNLLSGTTSEEMTGLRDNNLKFVGTWENGKRNIQYLPIISDDVEEALRIFLAYYNSSVDNEENEYNAILKPIIYHGLIAALQLFKDGNTRYARTIQHVELWGMLNKIVEDKIELPITYATRQYFPFRNKYRELIKNIAINGSEEAWNDWFNFNIHRIQDTIYKSESNAQVLTKKYR